MDLLAQRAHRPRAAPARDAVPRVVRARQGARPPGLALGERRPARDRLGPRQRQRGRLDEPADRRRARRRRAPARRVRRLGAARGRADAADALLPRPGLRGRERRVAVHVLRHVRRDLPADAVLPDRSGLLAARRGPARAAVDGDADVVAPIAGALSDRIGGRPLMATGLALQALGSPGSPSSRRRPSGTARSSGRSSSRESGWRSSSPRSRTSSCRPCARGGGQGLGHQQRHPRGRRRARRRRPRLDLLPPRRLQSPDDVQRRSRARDLGRSGSRRRRLRDRALHPAAPQAEQAVGRSDELVAQVAEAA